MVIDWTSFGLGVFALGSVELVVAIAFVLWSNYIFSRITSWVELMANVGPLQ